MIYSLLHGDVMSALRFNAMAVLALGFLVAAFALWTWGRISNRTMASWQHHRWAAPVTLTLVLAWFVVRLLPYEPFAALRV